MRNDEATSCALCERIKPLTFHHFIPRSVHKNKWFKKNFSKEQMTESGIMICKDCHKNLHKTYPNKLLAREFNNTEAILQDERIRRFTQWIRKQK